MTEDSKPRPVLNLDSLYKIYPPEDHEVYMVIGQVASLWSLLEYYLDELIWKLSNTPETLGVCVTSQLFGSGPRMNAIIALMIASDFSRKQVDKAHEIRESLLEPNEMRNRLIHDPTMISSTGTVKFVRGADRKSIQRRKDRPYALRTGILVEGGIADARAALANVGRAHDKVSELRSMIWDGPPPSPDK